MLLAALLVFIIVAVIWYIAACKAAGKKDRWEEKWIEQRKAEASKNYVWCDDECLYCNENQLCKFSEVRINDN